MAKKTDKKLALKRETLRTLSDDQLHAVAGGTIVNYDWSIYGQGGLLTSRTAPPPPPPTGDTLSVYQYKYYP